MVAVQRFGVQLPTPTVLVFKMPMISWSAASGAGQLQHSMGGRSLPTRETAPSAVPAAIMPLRQKLRPMSGLEPSSPRCNMVPNHVRLLYWWHLRAIANDPDRQAGFLRDWAGACLFALVYWRCFMVATRARTQRRQVEDLACVHPN